MPATTAERLRGRAHWWVHRAREEARHLRSPRRTLLKPPDGQAAPAPSRFASFGEGSWLVPPMRAHNPERMAIGRDVIVLEFATLWAFAEGSAQSAPVLTLGDGVRLTRFCSVIAEVGVTIGAGVASSDMATVTDTWRLPLLGGRSPGLPWPDPAPVVIGAGAYLGMNSIVGPGVHVGEGAYIGENAVVTEDVPSHSVVQGNPARVVHRFGPGDGPAKAAR